MPCCALFDIFLQLLADPREREASLNPPHLVDSSGKIFHNSSDEKDTKSQIQVSYLRSPYARSTDTILCIQWRYDEHGRGR